MNSENFDKATSGIKNVIHVLVILVVVAAFFSHTLQNKLGSALASAGEAGVESVKVGELEFKLRKAEAAVKTLANNLPTLPPNPGPTPKTGDQSPSPAVASALEVINEPGSFWAYVGQISNDKYIKPRNFDVRGLPKPGDTVVALTDTNKRDREPIKTGADWQLGQIVGVVSQGKWVSVRNMKVIPDGNVWILAVSAKPPD